MKYKADEQTQIFEMRLLKVFSTTMQRSIIEQVLKYLPNEILENAPKQKSLDTTMV